MKPRNGGRTPPDVLKDVSLVSFTAEPDHIGPFTSSLLKWKIKAPAGVALSLDGAQVGPIGQQTVQPDATNTYVLFANAQTASMEVGSVTVWVDLSQCLIKDLPAVRWLEGWLGLAIQQLQQQGTPIDLKENSFVIVPDAIQFQLKLTYHAKGAINVDIDIDINGSFGLAIVSVPNVGIGFTNHLSPINQNVSVDASVPWWLYFVPGAMFGIAFVLDSAKTKGTKAATDIINGLTAQIDSSEVNPPGTEKQNVRIFVDSDGTGLVEITYCPPPQQLVVQQLAKAARPQGRRGAVSRRPGP